MRQVDRVRARFVRGARALIPQEKRWRYVRLLQWAPPVFIWVMRHFHEEWQVVDRRTDLVIEGYESSANTFARGAMQSVNPDARIASHVHSWAHVAYALMLRKPVLILLRPPEDAIASRLVRIGRDDPRRELTVYADFHRGVGRFRNRCVVASFAEVTTRFGDVIDRVNRTYGTSFVRFDHDDPARTEEVFADIDRRKEAAGQGMWAVARPLDERKVATASVRAQLSAEFAASLARCQQLHDRLLDSANAR